MRRTERITTPVMPSFAVLLAIALLTAVAPAQKSAPVTVTNTASSPVPVTGGVTVTNTGGNPVPVYMAASPVVSAEQRGAWNVGITGTVRLHPDTAIVSVARNPVYSVGQKRDWGQDPSTFYVRVDSPYYTKYRVCVLNNAPQAVFVSVAGEVLLGNSLTYGIEDFTMSGQTRSCRIYDLPGEALEVRVQNTGNNNSGDVRVNIVAQ